MEQNPSCFTSFFQFYSQDIVQPSLQAAVKFRAKTHQLYPERLLGAALSH